MATSTRTILSSDVDLIVMSDNSVRLLGPLPPAVVSAGKINGRVRVTDVNDLDFSIPLTGPGVVATPDPALKAMAKAGSNSETIIGQALPDGAPNQQYPLAQLQSHIDTISFANADKLSSVATLTNGLMTSTGFNFTTGNNARAAISVPQIQLHGCMHWHKGNPTNWNPTASTVKGQIDIIVAAFKKNWDDRGYTAALKYADAVNEIVDNAVSDFVNRGAITTAFRANTDWSNEMAALNIPAISADPGAWGWLYFVRRMREVWGPSVQLAMADFGLAENTAVYGYGVNADGWATFSHQAQRWERACYNLRNGMRAEAAGYPGRIDNLNFQSHLSPGRIIVPTDLHWRNYEANMLGCGVMMGEINLLLASAESAGAHAAAGVVPGTPEEVLWNINYVATYITLMRASCERLKLIQPWTDTTDFADGALTTFDKDGTLGVVGRGIQRAFQAPVVKNAIRGGRTLFGKANGFKPYELEGTLAAGGPGGIRGTNIKLPMTRYLRRDVTDGVVKPMSAARWDQTFFFNRSGGAAAVTGGRLLYLEDAGGAAVASITFNNNDLQLVTAAGIATLSTTSNGDYLRVAMQYRDGVLKACVSRRSSANGNPITTGAVYTQTVNLPAIAKIGLVDGTSSSTVIEHRIYDETHLAANDAALQAKATLTANTGTALRAADIFSGAAMAA